MTPEQERERGFQARRILDDAMYREAHDTVRERIVQLLEQDQQQDKRDRLTADLRSLRRVQGYLEQVMVGGKMAAEQIERDLTFSERVRDRMQKFG